MTAGLLVGVTAALAQTGPGSIVQSQAGKIWVLNEALRQGHLWRQAGWPLRIAVNVSARNLHHPGFADDVTKLLDRWGLEASSLELEITESTVMADPMRAIEVLGSLRRLGVRVAIDDFGTGYSSLAYLQRLPVDVIKIDRSFVMNVQANHGDSIIVRSTIDLGRNLGLVVTAEGVEDARTRRRLTELGCDFVQGYELCRPLPAERCAEAIRETPVLAPVTRLAGSAVL